jgi:hypothetical protein
MAKTVKEPTAATKYVRDCLLKIRDYHRDQLRRETQNPRARYSYGSAALIIGKWLGRSAATVKIWASIDKRDIPLAELKKLKDYMRTHYGQATSS